MKWCLEHPGPYTLNEEIELEKGRWLPSSSPSKPGISPAWTVWSRHYLSAFALEQQSGRRSEQQLGRIVAGLDLPVLRPIQVSGLPGRQEGQILAKLVVHHDHMGEAMKAAFHSAFEVAGTRMEQIDGWRLVERMERCRCAYAEIPGMRGLQPTPTPKQRNWPDRRHTFHSPLDRSDVLSVPPITVRIWLNRRGQGRCGRSRTCLQTAHEAHPRGSSGRGDRCPLV